MTKSLTFSDVIDTCIFHVWGLKNIVAKTFLRQNCLLLVFQMLIRTCSHPPLIETEDMTESNQSEQTGTKVTFKDFIELWDTLFNSPRIKVREPVSLLSHSSVKKKSFATLYTFMYIPAFFHLSISTHNFSFLSILDQQIYTN